MSQKIRRTLAVVAVLAALSLALPSPSQAASLWNWQSADLAARVWSWLQGFGLVPQGEKPSSGLEKQGSMIDPDGGKTPGSTPPSMTSDQGSMIDPDGAK
jgi:hypothetical protein